MAALQKRGLRTRLTASLWSAAPLVTSFRRVLTNPYYEDNVTINGTRLAGASKALASATIWEAVQLLLSAWQNNEHGRIYDYFVCCSRRKGTPGCMQRALPIVNVESRVEEAYSSIEISDIQWGRLNSLTDDVSPASLGIESRAWPSSLSNSTLLRCVMRSCLFSTTLHEMLIREQKKLSQEMARIGGDEHEWAETWRLSCNRYRTSRKSEQNRRYSRSEFGWTRADSNHMR